ncbi:MAG: sulfotransferase [Chitinophagales bacterium]|nr:sulfotransferase [Chitinophagales bacterium]
MPCTKSDSTSYRFLLPKIIPTYMNQTPIQDIQMHFIIGYGRSGTTLLNNVLNAHPNVLATPENRFMLFFNQYFAPKTQLSRADIDFFCDNAFKIRDKAPTDFRTWLVNQERLRQSLYDQLPNLHYIDLYKITYLHNFLALQKNDIRTIIDKNPSYTLFTDDLLQLFPNAKFVLMVRDYRDNMLSHLRHQMDAVVNPWFVGHLWRNFNARILHLQQQHPNRVRLLRYEDLIADFEGQVQQICQFLGIEFLPEMLQYQNSFAQNLGKVKAAIEQYDPEILQAMHENVAKPINKSNVQTWKTKMSYEQQQIADYICGDLGEKFGYSRATTLNNWQQKLHFLANNQYYKTLAQLQIQYIRTYFHSPTQWRTRKIQLNNVTPIPTYPNH